MFVKVVVVLLGFLGIVLALPVDPVPIVSQSQDISPDGSYQWNYQSGDGTAQQAVGQLKQLDHDAGEVVSGSASWVDPEGNPHQLSYVADENGYQPSSADLPVSPEVPAAILRALEWIAAHPPPPAPTKRL